MSEVEFTNNSMQIKKALREKAIAFLEEAAGEVQTAVHNASRVDTGETRGSYTYVVDESALEATVGAPEENAIWEEFGTGEYALHGDGRKGGWYIRMKKGMDTSHMVRHQTDRLRRLSRQRRVQFSTGQMRYSES